MQNWDVWGSLLFILVSLGGFVDRYGNLILHIVEVYLKVAGHLSTPSKSKPHRTRRKTVVRKKPRHRF